MKTIPPLHPLAVFHSVKHRCLNHTHYLILFRIFGEGQELNQLLVTRMSIPFVVVALGKRQKYWACVWSHIP